MGKPELQRGGCVVFAWGPPWTWWPSVQRSRHGNGVSLTWLWWGLYWIPAPVATVLVGGAMLRRVLDGTAPPQQAAAYLERLRDNS